MEENDFITRLFQDQREDEQADSPTFSMVYGKAHQKQIKMKRKKRLVWALAASFMLLLGIAYSLNPALKGGESITVLKAGVPLYDRLIKDGKIVTNDIHFDYDKADLRSSSMDIIKSIAKMMEQHPEVRLSVEGHTDNTGSSDYNLRLSDARAASVMQALLDLSIDSDRLSSKGYGESKPISNNDQEQGRAKNRRVEFVLMK